jgi:hypothetical protein
LINGVTRGASLSSLVDLVVLSPKSRYCKQQSKLRHWGKLKYLGLVFGSPEPDPKLLKEKERRP